MKKLPRWLAFAALACAAAAAATAVRVADGQQAPSKSLPATATWPVVLGESPLKSYSAGKRCLVTLDLGTITVSSTATDYTCTLTYLADDGSASGTVKQEDWKVLSAHGHPNQPGNIVTLKLKTKRTFPVKVKAARAGGLDDGTGTGTIVISMPNVIPPPGSTAPPTTPVIPVDDVGIDPCDDK